MDSRLKFRMWFKYGLKAQKFLAQGNGHKQHALKGQKLLAQGNGHKQHALKGQKLLAQGNALGVVAISKAPCKGKSFVNYLILKAFALTGRQVCVHKHPGRCPGLGASALSGRMGLTFLPFYFSTISPPLGCISTFRFPFLSTFTVFI